MRRQVYMTTIEAGPRGGRIIPVPFDPDAAWGAKDRHHITGSVAGMPVRGTADTRARRAAQAVEALRAGRQTYR